MIPPLVVIPAPEADVQSSIETETETEITIPGLPSHLRCHSTPSSGRTVSTRIDLRKGSTALREVPFAHAIHYAARGTTCDACFAQCDDSPGTGGLLRYACDGGCGVRYCTEPCRRQSLPRHERACHLIRQTNGKNGHSRLMNESLSLLIALSSNDRPLRGVMGMMMEDGTKKDRRDTARAETNFRALAHGDVELERPGAYAAALGVKKLNAFGIFNSHGDEVAYALCPALAMVNHSCLPNCQQISDGGSCRLRALRDIEAGEELSYSYVSLEGTDVERKGAIVDNWEFICRCHRCRGGDCSAFDVAHVCYCGAVCYEVDRTQSDCVCNGPTV
mmetsp:Transcript_20889/g.38327  ORF Transcript_20889/g.38327 Transcript_20889/m.38327 type:complete len:333 (-) Transcript_20889:17-1015(-)